MVELWNLITEVLMSNITDLSHVVSVQRTFCDAVVWLADLWTAVSPVKPCLQVLQTWGVDLDALCAAGLWQFEC